MRQVGPIRFVQFRPEFHVLFVFHQHAKQQFLPQFRIVGQTRLGEQRANPEAALGFRVSQLIKGDFCGRNVGKPGQR